jgi:hypothetical protein
LNPDEAMNLGANAEIEVGNPADGADPTAIKSLCERTKRELLRHQISERDLRVSVTLCNISFGLGIMSVKIPKLETLGDLVGLPRQHVYTALQRLHEMRIVTVRPKEGLYLYTVNPNSESWKVAPRVSLATVLRSTETIRELNGIPEDPASENSAPHDPRQILLFGVTDAVTVTAETFPQID